MVYDYDSEIEKVTVRYRDGSIHPLDIKKEKFSIISSFDDALDNKREKMPGESLMLFENEIAI